jgi:hypothetical protein
MRNMSFALTTPQVLDQSKDVTRRLGWEFLKVGDLFQPCKKCMGLGSGGKIERLGGPVLTIDKVREPLSEMVRRPAYGEYECSREGFGHLTPAQFVEMFCDTHRGCTPASVVTRIHFSYDHFPGWRPMTTAPRTGTHIEVLVRHFNWRLAKGIEKTRWEQIVHAQWINFNGSGWSWAGIAGTAMVWRPLP